MTTNMTSFEPTFVDTGSVGAVGGSSSSFTEIKDTSDAEAQLKSLCKEFVEKLRIPTFDDDAQVVFARLAGMVEGVLSQPSHEEPRAIQTKSKAVLDILERFPQAMEYLEIVGFKHNTKKQAYEFPSQQDVTSKKSLRTGLQVLSEAMANLEDVHIKQEEETQPDFNFQYDKHLIFRLNQDTPKSSGRNELLEQKVSQLKEQQDAAVSGSVSNIIKNRNLTIIDSQKKKSRMSSLNLKEKFGMMKNSSLKDDELITKLVLQGDIEHSQQAANFQTKAMRDLITLERKQRKGRVYTETLIRVQFPDHLVIQATFSPLETIADVEAQVMKCMNLPSNTKFYLFQRPYRKKLNPNTKLQDLGLVPRARVHVAWQGEAPEGEYIRDELFNQTENKSQQKSELQDEKDTKIEQGLLFSRFASK